MNAKLTINLANLKHNYFYAKSLTNNDIFAVLKTNAYGLGVEKISQFLSPFVDGFAVATINEALDLKVKNSILIMIGCFDKAELKIAINNNFIIAITTKQQAQNLIDFDSNKAIKIFLKYDCGMHRLGLNKKQFIKYYQILKDKKNIDITMMSHFCCSENIKISKQQNSELNALKNQLQISKTSFANSVGILNKLTPNSVNRLGISLYGVNLTNKKHNLKTVATLTATIIAIKKLKLGDYVGYNQTFKAQKSMQIAVVKIGYGDGYPRNIKAKTPVFINNQVSVILGKVSMDMLVIDVSEIFVAINDKVELFGENIAIEEVANSANTIPYEIFCNMSLRIKKIYC